MVRPLTGERPKKTTTISIDPVEWSTFQDLVANKVFPKTSASAHVENLIRQENARLSGEDSAASAGINEIQLQKRLITLLKQRMGIVKSLSEGA